MLLLWLLVNIYYLCIVTITTTIVTTTITTTTTTTASIIRICIITTTIIVIIIIDTIDIFRGAPAGHARLGRAARVQGRREGVGSSQRGGLVKGGFIILCVIITYYCLYIIIS